MSNPCCGPGRDGHGSTAQSGYLEAALCVPEADEPLRAALGASLIEIKGGFFDMGTRRSRFAGDFDAPCRKVKLSSFRISATACSNAEYGRFIRATGYRTVAEREGWSSVFFHFLKDAEKYKQSPPGLPWWRRVDGAFWAAPEGLGSDILGRENHPVVHICWFDALAYCTWSGLCLLTEAQWEYAARGGLVRAKFPWGNELHPSGKHAMNIWQGSFPTENTADDGFTGTAPVRFFAPNGYGIYNACGNVWEWVSDRFVPEPAGGPFPLRDPEGPAQGKQRVQRGGSYLCHDSYCDRYHVYSRTHNDPDSSTGHVGFRVAGR